MRDEPGLPEVVLEIARGEVLAASGPPTTSDKPALWPGSMPPLMLAFLAKAHAGDQRPKCLLVGLI
jgi:hypothetical protein